MTSRSRRIHIALRSFVAVAGALALGLPGTSRAGGRGLEATTEVNAFSGAFQTQVPIGVPAFHGLEPKLGLFYSSQGGNGPVGLGWSLGGISTIERAAPGRGAPRYDGTDIYVLDGNELVPSCTTFGGSYCTRIQSYQRITWAGGSNPWYVWAKDGTKATYTAVLNLAKGTHRWMLSEVRDTKNNYVTYTPVCSGGDCYLDSVTYNGVTVKLYYEGRTDTVTYGVGGQNLCTKTCYQTCYDKYGFPYQCNPYTCDYACGAGGLATMVYRLKTVDVLVSGSRARSYKIQYGYTGRTGQSQVSSIAQYGTDAVVDGAGTVTGGTALPAATFGYNANPGNSFALARWATQAGGYWDTQRWFTGDFNGDGKTDFAKAFNDNGYASFDVHLSTGSGFTLARWLTQSGVFSDSQRWFVGDFNGDGKTDFLRYWNDANQWTADVLLSTGSSFYNARWATRQGGYSDAMQWFVGDFNGDGKTDCAKAFNDNGYISFDVHVSSGSSFSMQRWATYTGPWSESHKWVVGDFNGDGKIDFAKYFGEDGLFVADVHLSSGSAFATARWESQAGGFSDDQKWLTGDFNGDGKTDFVNIWNDGGNTSLDVHVSTGQSFSLQRWGTQQGGFDVAHKWLVGDINGDGLADLVNVWNHYGSATFDAHLSSGYGFGWTQWALQSGGIWDGMHWYLEDFTGDGKLDMAKFWNDAGSWTADVHVSTGDPGNATLTTLANGLGGTTTVAYKPSTYWGSHSLPVGMIIHAAYSVSANDGRGDVQTTTYAYQNAKWNAPDRELLGFRKATTTLAATGAYSETYYWQRAGTIAKPEVIYKRKSGGAILSFDKYKFTEDATPPYTSLVTEAWAYECNGDGVVDANNNYVSGCRRVATTYEWDTYANLVAEYQHGNYDLAGDERTAVRSFVPNTTTYVVGLPAYDELRAGIGKTGTILTRTRFFYDGAASETTAPSAGLLTKKGVWNDQTGLYVEHSFGYDSYGNETSVTDPLNRVSTRTYDSTYHALVTSTTNPAAHVVQTGWNTVLGLPTSETDANGNVKSHSYDVLGRATLSTSPDGAQVKIEYLSWGSPTSQRIKTSRLLPGSVWVADEDYFDGLGRPYKKTSGNGVIEETIYGATGKVWKKSLPYASGETVRYDEYTYDEVGRELSVKRPDGTLSSRSYDDGSVTVTPPTGSARTTYYDGFGRITKARETIGGVAKDAAFYYDLLGRRTKSVDAVGYQTVATYDSLGRVIQRSDPDKGLWSYAYDALGRLTRETDALTRATTLAYDTLGRVTRRTFSDATYETFTFDETGRGSSKGRLTTAVASGVTTRAYYDTLGRRTKYEEVIDGTTYTLSHTYDVAGRLATATYPDGEVVTYGYGTSGFALGRLTTVSGSLAGSLVTGVTYTSRGQVATITYANGVTTTTGFDAYGERVSSIQIGSLATINYGYDANGFVTSMTSPQLTLTRWSYGYDSVGRLTSAVNTGDSSRTESYGFDAIGRITSRTGLGAYTYGDSAHVHAVTSANSVTYAYDANGNLTAGAGRALTYGLNHKVASVTRAGATTTFTYDAQGLRVKKVGSAGTIIYVGGVYEKRGTAITKYYFAGGARIAKRDANGNQYLHADHLGSTRLVTNASGAEVKRYEYAPWGNVISESGTRPENHRFTGQEADDETGLMFFQARYYDPALGRFLQADAFLPDANSPQALDLYAYANNSPSNYVDPSGHAPVVIAIATWAGASAATIAAITAASTLINIAALVIGTALTFTNNPFLQTLGMIMTGMAGAALAGPLVGLNAAQSCVVAGAVALAQSPISPLDPSIKKVIGWGYTIWGGITSVAKLGTGTDVLSEMTWGRVGNMTAGEVAKGVLASAWKDIKSLVGGWALAYALSKWGGTGGRYLLAIGGRFLLLGGSQLLDPGYNGALAMVGATYDLAYSLKYPDGRVYDLSGGAGGETFILYCHTGYENPLAFGRQHIRVGDPQGGYWELGDFRAGYFGPGLGWAGWGSTQKITVILDSNAAARFRDALKVGGSSGGAYVGFHRDSYTYVSAALQFATGKSAADLHINPGLIHW